LRGSSNGFLRVGICHYWKSGDMNLSRLPGVRAPMALDE
jgi:hypothetical protein